MAPTLVKQIPCLSQGLKCMLPTNQRLNIWDSLELRDVLTINIFRK